MRTCIKEQTENKAALNPQCGCGADSGAVPVLAADVLASAEASAWPPS